MKHAERITPREQDILNQMKRGKQDKEIAHILNMRIPTLDTHKHHLFQKLGVNNRTDAVIQALRQRIISLDPE